MSNASVGDLPGKSNNPANPRAKRVTAVTRIPMSAPRQKLEVPEIENFHLHWFLARNVPSAQAAGYEFVGQDEVELNGVGVAEGSEDSGHTDLGSRVSIIGGLDARDEPERLYLMKLPSEWWLADQQRLEERNERIAAALRGGIVGAEKDPDIAKRYLKQGQDLFIPKKKR